MNKIQFISQLKSNLSRLPVEEAENAVSYYSEYFDDAESGNQNTNEEIIIKELGSPSKIASQIIANYALSDVQTYPKSAKNSISKFWIVILALFASPIALPIAIAIASLAFALIITVATLIFSFGIISISFIAGGIVVIIVSLRFLFTDIATSIFCIGSGAILLGLGLALFPIVIASTKKSLNWITRLTSKLLLRGNLNE